MAFISLNIQGEEKSESTYGGHHGHSGLLESLRPGRIPVLVELDPPQHLDVTSTIEGAKALSASSADAITLAEHPLAILRADNLFLAHLIRSETGI
ncbi:MAG: hypothetical protein ACUVQ2_01340 [Dissulfurimicrobium sp.]|uniref:hypothetical protein n=1 Tax=Dissulfurimicrobium sp. TaxID=2022436 RepID=UPI00404BA267